MDKLFVPSGRKYSVPERIVPRRPAKSTRRYLHDEVGLIPVNVQEGEMERFDTEFPSLARDAVTIFLTEHCLFNDDIGMWSRFESNRKLQGAIDAGRDVAVGKKKDSYRLFGLCGGDIAKTAYLVCAEHWDEIADAVCKTMGFDKHYESIVTKSRPRGGMPMYDESKRTLAELIEKGEWDY